MALYQENVTYVARADGDYWGEEIRFRMIYNGKKYRLGIDSTIYDYENCNGCPTCEGCDMTSTFEVYNFNTENELDKFLERTYGRVRLEKEGR